MRSVFKCLESRGLYPSGSTLFSGHSNEVASYASDLRDAMSERRQSEIFALAVPTAFWPVRRRLATAVAKSQLMSSVGKGR